MAATPMMSLCRDLEVIKYFACSTQLSMLFQLLIITKRLKNPGCTCFESLKWCIDPANICLNDINFMPSLVEHEQGS